jgi:putative FmdB family regulatory protein
MPVYQYGCNICQTTHEIRQRFDDEPLSECPSCGGTIRRMFQPVGIIFKGSGWYCTDSRPKGSEEKTCAADDKKASAAA